MHTTRAEMCKIPHKECVHAHAGLREGNGGADVQGKWKRSVRQPASWRQCVFGRATQWRATKKARRPHVHITQ
eukprot:12725654-Alexandrium_andersonii.AAC.1